MIRSYNEDEIITYSRYRAGTFMFLMIRCSG